MILNILNKFDYIRKILYALIFNIVFKFVLVSQMNFEFFNLNFNEKMFIYGILKNKVYIRGVRDQYDNGCMITC